MICRSRRFGSPWVAFSHLLACATGLNLAFTALLKNRLRIILSVVLTMTSLGILVGKCFWGSCLAGVLGDLGWQVFAPTLAAWSPVSGRRMSGTSRPSAGPQVLALFSFTSWAKALFKQVWDYTWKSQTAFYQTSANASVHAKSVADLATLAPHRLKHHKCSHSLNSNSHKNLQDTLVIRAAQEPKPRITSKPCCITAAFAVEISRERQAQSQDADSQGQMTEEGFYHSMSVDFLRTSGAFLWWNDLRKFHHWILLQDFEATHGKADILKSSVNLASRHDENAMKHPGAGSEGGLGHENTIKTEVWQKLTQTTKWGERDGHHCVRKRFWPRFDRGNRVFRGGVERAIWTSLCTSLRAKMAIICRIICSKIAVLGPRS